MRSLVVVECDRCHRPVARIVETDDGRIQLDGPQVTGADGSAYWAAVLRDPQAHSYHARTLRGDRAGAFLVDADPSWLNAELPVRERHKLICVGRKHPRYERVVTGRGVLLAYAKACEAGRTRIGMRELG